DAMLVLEGHRAPGDAPAVDRASPDASPQGLAWFHTSGTFAMGGYLRLLAVVAGAERRGAGAALLAEFERRVAEARRHAFLLVSEYNIDAQRFYERHGYARVGSLARLLLPDVDELIYWKRLR